MKKILISLMFGCSVIGTAYAVESGNVVVAKAVDSSKPVVPVVGTVVGYALTTEAGLDRVWQNREKLTNKEQTNIANYYLTA